MSRIYVNLTGDTLHAAHVELLRSARELGDELVVGIPSDEDCEWLIARPIRTLQERARTVAACRYVDHVIVGAPLRVTEAWLREQRIDLVADGDGGSEAVLAYWHSVPMKLGMFRRVPSVAGGLSGDFKPRVHFADSSPQFPLRELAVYGLARLPAIDRSLQRWVFGSSLRRLNDALRGTPIDGRYWLWGGLLIGWAREGRPLAADLDDADFAYLESDHGRFLDSIPALVAAGFTPQRRFSSGEGCYVEHVLYRRRASFEFFRLRPRGKRWQYSVFSWKPDFSDFTELIAEIPAQPRVPFSFLRRQWLKVADHDLELRTIYGDWRTPRSDWQYTNDHAVVERVPLPLLATAWHWPEAIVRGPGERATVEWQVPDVAQMRIPTSDGPP